MGEITLVLPYIKKKGVLPALLINFRSLTLKVETQKSDVSMDQRNLRAFLRIDPQILSQPTDSLKTCNFSTAQPNLWVKIPSERYF